MRVKRTAWARQCWHQTNKLSDPVSHRKCGLNRFHCHHEGTFTTLTNWRLPLSSPASCLHETHPATLVCPYWIPTLRPQLGIKDSCVMVTESSGKYLGAVAGDRHTEGSFCLRQKAKRCRLFSHEECQLHHRLPPPFLSLFLLFLCCNLYRDHFSHFQELSA